MNTTKCSDHIKVISDKESVDQLGECPIWNYKEQILYWKDMLRGLLRSYCPKTKIIKSYQLSQPFGWMVNSEKGGLISALRNTIVRLQLEPNLKEDQLDVFPLKGKEHLAKFNDGKCDWQGRIWFGTSDVELKNPTAEFFMMTSDLKVTKKEGNLTIFNGPTFSLDSKYYYFADSPKQTIYRCDFNKESGELTNKIDYLKIEEGYPDGATIDSEGNIWWAIYGAGKILKISTEGSTGKIISEIKVPVENPSSLSFGDENLTTLFVTSISYEPNFEKQLDFPNGCLLAIDMSGFSNVKGVKEAFFKEV